MSKRTREEKKLKHIIEVYHLISTVSILEKLIKGTKVSHYKVDTHYRLSDNTHRSVTSYTKDDLPRKLLNIIENRIAFDEITKARGMKVPTKRTRDNELEKFKVKSVIIYV